MQQQAILIIVIIIPGMSNSITSIELYSFGILLRDWINSEVVAIVFSKGNGIAGIVS